MQVQCRVRCPMPINAVEWSRSWNRFDHSEFGRPEQGRRLNSYESEVLLQTGIPQEHEIPHAGSWTMKAIVGMEQAAGTAGMLLERPEPEAAINDVVVQIHASGFVPTDLDWPSTWPIADGNKDTIDPRARVGRSRHRPRLWHDGSVGGAARVRPRRLVSRRHARGTYCHGGAQSRPFAGRRRLHGGRESAISGLAAWQGLFQHGRLQAGQGVLAHGAAGAVGSMVTQLAGEAGAYVIGTDAPPTVRRRSTSAQTNCRPRERRSERRRWGRS